MLGLGNRFHGPLPGLATEYALCLRSRNFGAPPMIGKIRRLLALHGLSDVIRLSVTRIWQKVFWFTPTQRRARSRRQGWDSDFDRRWSENIDTGGIVLPDEDDVVGPNWIYGVKYKGSTPEKLEREIRELAIEYEKFTFVDLGSGKGRAILVASQFPFKKVIGVEYSMQFDRIARANLDRFPSHKKRCVEIEFVCADASQFPIPDGPVVIYMFHPFGRPVMEKVVQNVRNSLKAKPRRIIVIYSGAKFVDLWRATDFIQEARKTNWNVNFDTHGR